MCCGAASRPTPANKRLHLTPRHGTGVSTLVIYSVGCCFQFSIRFAAQVSRMPLGGADSKDTNEELRQFSPISSDRETRLPDSCRSVP